MKQNFKIVVVGLGYVGLSNAVLLAQHNEVIGVDISQDRVDALNARRSPIVDEELSQYLAEKDLNLSASTDLKSSVGGADYVIVSTPTNYDEQTNFFDTSSVEEVIAQVIESEPRACIVVKSTIPVGFIEDVRERLDTDAVIFSPEFLREGKELYDNLNPSRIIVGEKSERAEMFAKLLAEGAIKSDISKYRVVVPNGSVSSIAGLVEKPNVSDALSNLASVGRYVLMPDIFDTLQGLEAGSGGEIQLADAINIHAQQGSVDTVRLNGQRFDFGSLDGFMRASHHEYFKRLIV